MGTPNCLISDNSKVQIRAKVHSLLGYSTIKDHQSEPYYQNQNYAERRIQEIKRFCNTIMDRTGTPPEMWLLCLMFVVFLMNQLSTESLGGITPIEAAFNYKPDASPLLGLMTCAVRPARFQRLPERSRDVGLALRKQKAI
jgi:hypothetical protein